MNLETEGRGHAERFALADKKIGATNTLRIGITDIAKQYLHDLHHPAPLHHPAHL